MPILIDYGFIQPSPSGACFHLNDNYVTLCYLDVLCLFTIKYTILCCTLGMMCGNMIICFGWVGL
jgi:hypothetical protein